MKVVLICSRSFGSIVSIGEDILKNEGFEMKRISPEERPLNEVKLSQIIAREKPVALICGAEPITAKVLCASDSLRMVMKHGIGVDNIDIEAATQLKISVANAPGTNTDGVADLAITLMLMLLRRTYQACHSTKAGGWDRYIGHDLGALTVGIIGTGRIGIAVISRLNGFGSEILAFDQIEKPELESQYGVHYVSCDELLSRSDVVTLHVPLSKQTKNMLGARELQLMRESAVLVNVARGELIDEQALHNTLQTKRISGAALDVFSTEPPQESPLLKLENVLSTPHIAAYTYESMERMDKMCGEIIVDTFNEKRSQNILNPNVLNWA